MIELLTIFLVAFVGGIIITAGSAPRRHRWTELDSADVATAHRRARR